jgi:hypothetical protein
MATISHKRLGAGCPSGSLKKRVSPRYAAFCGRVGASCVVRVAAELEVGQQVGSTVSQWDPMVYLKAIHSAADHAGPVSPMDESSEPTPFPTAPDLPTLLPRTLPFPFPLAFGASAGCFADAVAAGAEVAERAHVGLVVTDEGSRVPLRVSHDADDLAVSWESLYQSSRGGGRQPTRCERGLARSLRGNRGREAIAQLAADPTLNGELDDTAANGLLTGALARADTGRHES